MEEVLAKNKQFLEFAKRDLKNFRVNDYTTAMGELFKPKPFYPFFAGVIKFFKGDEFNYTGDKNQVKEGLKAIGGDNGKFIEDLKVYCEDDKFIELAKEPVYSRLLAMEKIWADNKIEKNLLIDDMSYAVAIHDVLARFLKLAKEINPVLPAEA